MEDAMKRRLWVLMGVAATLIAGQLMVLAAPAWAALNGLVKVVTLGATNSDSKVEVATCPRGKVVVGGGGVASGGGSPYVHLTSLRPREDLNGFEVAATEVEGGTPLNWTLEAIAMCAAPPPGLAYVVTPPVAVGPEGTSVTASAVCPGRGVVIGLGGQINGGSGEVGFQVVRPTPNLTMVTTTAYEDWNGYDETWSLTAFAVCADLAGEVSLITTVGIYDASSPKSGAAKCVGLNAYGTGFFIADGAGHVLVRAVSVGNLLGVSPHTGAAAGRHPTAPIDQWGVVVYAICGA
jgi:hypothetical protein